MSSVDGKIEFEVDGETYALQYGMNALIDLEDHYDCGIEEIGVKLSGEDGKAVRLGDVRQIFLAGLKQHQPDMDLVQAGNIMTSLGTTEVEKVVGKAFALAFPEAVQKAGGAKGSPRSKKR